MSNLSDKYTYRVEWSEEDGVHVATCLEMSTLKAHGKTMESALKNIKKAVRISVKWMQDENEPVPEPFGLKKYRGHLSLRTTPDVHRLIIMKAKEQGVSVNQYIISRVVS